MPVGNGGSTALVEAVRRLDAAGVETEDLALHRPSLDDVFLAVTGHAAEVAPDGAPKGRKQPQPRGWHRDRDRSTGGHPEPAQRRAERPLGDQRRARHDPAQPPGVDARPGLLVFTVVQPVIFVLLFRYVFGGAIHAPGSGGYVNYLMPGIIGQTAAFATFATAIALAQEATKGVIDRFRAMPMARSAVLAGRLIADSIRMLIVILVIVGVGYAVGFRFQNGVAGAVGMVLLAEAFGITVCAVSAFVGLAIKDEESVQAFGLIWLFPLTFVSSAFVPIATMPGWLQVFANNQPVTLVINAMRSMALGGPQFPLNPSLWESLLVAGRRAHRVRPARGVELPAGRLTPAVATDLARRQGSRRRSARRSP